MSLSDERASIEGRFVTGFTDAPIAFENVPDSSTVTAAKAEPSAWVRIAIRNGDAFTAGINGSTPRGEQQGRIWIQVFTPENTGTERARALAGIAATVFRHSRFDGIRCYEPEFRSVGIDDGWYQFNVNVPYRRFT